MSVRRYNDERIAAAIEALRASIVGDRTTPDFMGTAKTIGISHTQLRLWWRERDAAPVLHLHHRPAEEAPGEEPEEDHGAVFSLKEEDFLLHLAIEARVTGIKARKAESYVAAMQAIKEQKELYRELRAARPVAGLESLPEEEYRGRLQDEASVMEDAHLEIFVRVYLERHRLTLSPQGAA